MRICNECYNIAELELVESRDPRKPIAVTKCCEAFSFECETLDHYRSLVFELVNNQYDAMLEEFENIEKKIKEAFDNEVSPKSFVDNMDDLYFYCNGCDNFYAMDEAIKIAQGELKCVNCCYGIV